MRYTFKYEDADERNEIINQNPDKVLIEENNLVSGNFLIFSDNPENDTKQVVYVSVPEEEFYALKQRQEATDSAVLQLLMEGMM